MRNIASVFRRLQLQRALIALILGALLFVSTACGQPYSTIDEESKTPENQTQKNLNKDNSRVDYGDRIIRSVSNRQ